MVDLNQQVMAPDTLYSMNWAIEEFKRADSDHLTQSEKNDLQFYSGVAVTNLIRLAIHVVAGTIYWMTPWWGSFTYNAWYMIPTMIMCLILIPLIYGRLIKSRVFNNN